MFILFILFIIFGQNYVEGYSFDRIKGTNSIDLMNYRSTVMQYLNFESPVYPEAVERRTIACFFVFDKNASAELGNDLNSGQEYADKLAILGSLYMTHANIVVTNAGVEMWTHKDEILFPPDTTNNYEMDNILKRFQDYLNQTQNSTFGTKYAVGVLISKKRSVQGGATYGPPCSTSGASLINYRPNPWSIGGLLAHELAHTLSVDHPWNLPYLCQDFPDIPFCKTSGSLPEICLCKGNTYPPQQCLMTFNFGAAKRNAPRFTPCDIQMMNYFSSNISCLLQ